MNQHIFLKYHSGDGVEGLLGEGANDGDLGYGRSWRDWEELVIEIRGFLEGVFHMLPILFPHADEVEGRLLCFMSSKMHFKGIHYFPVAGETWLTDVWYVLEAPKSKILSFDVPALMVGQRMTQESSVDKMWAMCEKESWPWTALNPAQALRGRESKRAHQERL